MSSGTGRRDSSGEAGDPNGANPDILVESLTGEVTCAATAVAPSSSVPAPLRSDDSGCLLLALLGRDTGAQTVLCEMLDWRGVAHLYQTCSQWRRWLTALPTGGAYCSALRIALQKPLYLPSHSCVLSRWVRAVAIVGIDYEPARSDELTSALPLVAAACPQVQSLSLSLVAFDLQASAATVSCLAALAERLETLRVTWRSFGAAALNELLRLVGHMPRLQSLDFSCPTSSHSPPDATALDFSPLREAPALTRLSLGSVLVDCTLQQARDLAACRLLVDFPVCHSDIAVGAERVAEFIRCRPPDAAAIKHIPISCQFVLCAQMRAHLPFFRELRDLFSFLWDEAQWPLLSAFPRLTSLSLMALASAVWLPDLLQYGAALESLEISPDNLAAAELQSLVRALPRLSSLSISHCRLEAVSPLVEARALTSLGLFSCGQLGSYDAMDWRPLLPPLPLLRALSVTSPVESEAERAQHRAAVLERMPRLAAVNLHFPKKT